MTLSDLPRGTQLKKLKLLREDLERGSSLHSFSQIERDLLHMETSEENLNYWKNENAIAESDDRCRHCQSVWRNMLATLRAHEHTDDEHPLAHVLSETLEAAERLSPVH